MGELSWELRKGSTDGTPTCSSWVSSASPPHPQSPRPDVVGSSPPDHQCGAGGCLSARRPFSPLRFRLGPGGETAARCPLVAAAGTAGRSRRRAARARSAPGRDRFQPLRSAPGGRGPESCPVSPRPVAGLAGCQGPRGDRPAPSLTTCSGPGTRHSSTAARRSRSAGAGRQVRGRCVGGAGPHCPRVPSPAVPSLSPAGEPRAGSVRFPVTRPLQPRGRALAAGAWGQVVGQVVRRDGLRHLPACRTGARRAHAVGGGLTSVSGLRFLMMGFSRTDRWCW